MGPDRAVQQGDGARMGDHGRGPVVNLAPRVVVEGVIDAGVNVNPHLRPRFEMGGYRVHGVLRNE